MPSPDPWWGVGALIIERLVQFVRWLFWGRKRDHYQTELMRLELEDKQWVVDIEKSAQFHVTTRRSPITRALILTVTNVGKAAADVTSGEVRAFKRPEAGAHQIPEFEGRAMAPGAPGVVLQIPRSALKKLGAGPYMLLLHWRDGRGPQIRRFGF